MITAQSKSNKSYIQEKPQFEWIACDCSRIFRAHETTAITIMNNVRASIERLDSQSQNDAKESNQFEWMWWEEHLYVYASVRACALTIQFIVKYKSSLYSAHTLAAQQEPKLKQQNTQTRTHTHTQRVVCASLTFDYSLFSHSMLVFLFDIAEIATTNKHSSSFSHRLTAATFFLRSL